MPFVCERHSTSARKGSKWRLNHISGSPIRHVKYQWIALLFQPLLFGIGLCAYLLYAKAHLQVPKRAYNEDLGMLVGHPSGLGDIRGHFISCNFQPAILTVAFVHAFCMWKTFYKYPKGVHISGSPIRHVKYQWIAVYFQPALFGTGLCAYHLYVKAHLQVPKRAQNEDLGMLVGHPSGLETPTIISSFAIFIQDMWHKPLHMSYVNRHLQAPKRVRMKT